MKNGSLNSAGDVSMIPVGRARDPSLNLKGFIWLLKFYPSGEKVYVYIDKSQMKVKIYYVIYRPHFNHFVYRVLTCLKELWILRQTVTVTLG